MKHNTYEQLIPLVAFFGALLLVVGHAHADEPANVVVDSVVLSPLNEAEVPAQQTGLLYEILVTEGDIVEAGEDLAVLDLRQAELEVEQVRLEHAQAETKATNRVRVEYAEKSLEVAEAELRRSDDSVSKFAKSISESQLDVERLTVEQYRLEKKQAEHELELDEIEVRVKLNQLAAAQLRLDKHRIVAPFTGAVVLVRGRVGEWVEVGAPVVQLVGVDRLRAEGFLSADQVAAAKPGSKVIFRVDANHQSNGIEGVLRFVSPVMDPVTRQVRVWAEVSNTEGRLRPGQQGSLEIVREE